MLPYDHAIARAVSRWLPTVVAQIQAWVRYCEICDGQNGTGVGFLWVHHSPLPLLIPPIASYSSSSSSIIWGGTVGQIKPNSGQCTKWIQSHFTPAVNIMQLWGTVKYYRNNDSLQICFIFQNTEFWQSEWPYYWNLTVTMPS